MIRMLKYLSKSKLTVLAIVALLVLQAYCDLSLPKYTSDIVDVGIQQSGISQVTPEKLREETMENLYLFMEDSDIENVRAAYTLNDDGVYELNTSDKGIIEALDRIFGTPMMMLSAISSSGETDISQVRQAIDAGMMTKDALLSKADEMMAQYGDFSDSMTDQAAISFVSSEYEAMGVDMGAYQQSYLLRTGGRMLLLSLLMMCTAIVSGLLASKVAASVGRDLRGQVFHKVVAFSNAEIDKFSTASLITRSTNDIQQIQMVMVMLLRIVAYAPILGIGGIIRVSTTKTGMSWIIVAAVAVIVILVGILMSIALPKFKKMQELVDRMNLVSREILTGIPVIRAFSREKHEEARFETANKELMKTQLFTNRTMTFMMPAMMMIMNGVTVMIVWFGAQGIDAGRLQVGDMMAFITYTMQIVMSFLMITMISIMLPRASVAAARIDEVVQTKATINDPKKPQDEKLAACRGELTFDHVSFKYPGAEENVLSDITFTAEPGKTTAIIGSTGCGKSTLVQLIPRFFDATEGKITLDGVDIRDITLEKLHSTMGYVPQKAVLFSGDIESNLKFAGNVSDEDMKQAAEISQATEFIESKPEGYKRSIAQGGSNVSGGQKQRLAIARAIAKRPQLLLFDDSFSALDYKTDVILRRELGKKVKDAAVIIVAQRISTILHADQILVLDDGKIAGKGTHAELMANCSAYEEIARSQLSAAELEGGLA